MKLIIDRQTWLRGEGNDISYLLRPRDSKMCCLGFLGQQACGLTPEMLYGKKSPACWGFARDEWSQASWLFEPLDASLSKVENDLVDLITINDNQDLSSAEREAELTRIFALHDVQVEFIN